MIREISSDKVTIDELNNLFPINFTLEYLSRKYYKDEDNKLYEITYYGNKESEIINKVLEEMEKNQKKRELLKCFGID